MNTCRIHQVLLEFFYTVMSYLFIQRSYIAAFQDSLLRDALRITCGWFIYLNWPYTLNLRSLVEGSHTCMYANMNVCIHSFIYICMHKYIHIYILFLFLLR